MTPSVCCGSSIPANCFFSASTRLERASSSQLSECTNRTAGTRLRAAINIPASTSSFTAFAFAPGALMAARNLVPAVGNLHRVHVLRAHQDRVGVRGVLGDVVNLRRKALQADRGDLIEDEDFEFFCGHCRIINYVYFL